MIDESLKQKLKDIKLLILDADGVLTDGKIYYGSYGDEIKAFDVKDGLGLSLWKMTGKVSCILTAKKSPLLKRRAKDVKIFKVYQNAYKKIDVYRKLKKKFKLTDSEICYIGDDLIDIRVLKEAGFSVTVPSAPSEVKENSNYITDNPGGSGAVREIIELILKEQCLWDNLVQDLIGD
ncbi:MAG: HAD-IIIA family hydrolase [Candidatus Kaelpia aquatica]|nr:HAD-IIIA family hydrolase [Candidatus Kaelpia aquatica]